MKTSRRISLIVFAVLATIQVARSQDFKGHQIDASGKITDEDGKHIGNVMKDCVINDAAGKKVAYVDNKGILIDVWTGESLGKLGKTGKFVSYSAKSEDKSWSTSSPENGTCLVKDKDGNVKAVVHQTYKNIGASAVHCLTHRMNDGEVLDEKGVASASYACSMHPDVTSVIPDKCSQCGMEMAKKTTSGK